MSRDPRFDLPGNRHHVMNRGARREPVFLDDACCLRFLDLLSQLPARHGVSIHGYAIMPNHFHLMVACPEGKLGRAIQFLQAAYSRWLNQRFEWDGPVWRGRYASRVVEEEAHWLHLLAYLHLNPVEAGMAPWPDDARWTSHAAFVGSERSPEWLTMGDLHDLFGSIEAYRTYLHEVRIRREEGPGGLEPDIAPWPRSAIANRPPGAPSRPTGKAAWPLDLDAAWAALEIVSGLDRASLLAAPRGPTGNLGRTVVMWWLPRATGMGQGAVARIIGVDPAIVSRAAGRVRTGLPQDSLEREWVEKLSALLPGC
jgi:REP element-mobilizing transposase RayT